MPDHAVRLLTASCSESNTGMCSWSFEVTGSSRKVYRDAAQRPAAGLADVIESAHDLTEPVAIDGSHFRLHAVEV